MKITITGDLGSGKSSVANVVCQQLGYKYISTGELHRKIASEYKMNSLELNNLADTDNNIDERVDSFLMEINKEIGDFIIDSRLAWHFVRDTFKVYLQVDQDVGVERIFLAKGRLNEPEYHNRDSAKIKILARKLSENNRFEKKYNVRCNDFDNYDLIINTTFLTVLDTAKLLVKIIELLEKKENYTKFWVPPKLLYPTEHVRSLGSTEANELIQEIKSEGFDYRKPVQAIFYCDFYFIWDGHKRVSAALFNDLKIIPVELIAKDKEDDILGYSVKEFVLSVMNKSWYYDWEDIHQFHFNKYPENLL
jgi:CMP/dCMP kinase